MIADTERNVVGVVISAGPTLPWLRSDKVGVPGGARGGGVLPPGRVRHQVPGSGVPGIYQTGGGEGGLLKPCLWKLRHNLLRTYMRNYKINILRLLNHRRDKVLLFNPMPKGLVNKANAHFPSPDVIYIRVQLIVIHCVGDGRRWWPDVLAGHQFPPGQS